MRGLRGEQVYLRPLEPDDAEHIHRWYEDARVQTLMGEAPMSLAGAASDSRSRSRGTRGDVVHFVICRLADDDRSGGPTCSTSTGRTARARSGSPSANRSCGVGSRDGCRQRRWSTSPSASFGWSASGWTPTPGNTRAQAAYAKAGFARRRVPPRLVPGRPVERRRPDGAPARGVGGAPAQRDLGTRRRDAARPGTPTRADTPDEARSAGE